MALAVPLRVIPIAIGVHVLWGGNPVAVKFSLTVFPPLWAAFFRFLIAVVCIAVWARLNRIRFVPTRSEWPALVFIGTLFTVQIALMNIGFDRTTGSMGSVLIATNPLFAAFFAHVLIAGDRLNALRVTGLALAMAGTIVVLVSDADPSSLDFGASGNWLVLASAALLGLRLATTARVLRGIDEARVAIWQMLIALPLFALGGTLLEEIRWQHLSLPPVAGLLYQGVLVAGLGFMVTFHLMKRYRPSAVMSFNFVSPIAGVALAIGLLDEQAGPWLLAGMLLVAVGIWLIARER